MLSDATHNKYRKENECNTLSEIPIQSSLQCKSGLNFNKNIVKYCQYHRK